MSCVALFFREIYRGSRSLRTTYDGFSPPIQCGFIIASLAAGAILVSIVAIPQYLSWQARWDALRSHVGEIGQLAASVANGDLHRQLLVPANFSDELYARALAPLVRFHSANKNIFYLYTMVDHDGVPYFVLDTAASPDLRTEHKLEASAYMERFDIRKEYDDGWLEQIASGKTYVNPEFERDNYGDFLTGHAPIYDSQGRYSGFVGVDFDLQYYFAEEARFRAIAIGSLVSALVLALAIGLFGGALSLGHALPNGRALRQLHPRQPDGTAQQAWRHRGHQQVRGPTSWDQYDPAYRRRQSENDQRSSRPRCWRCGHCAHREL